MAFGFVFSPVPGATPKNPASGLIACRRPSGPNFIQAMSSPIVSTFQPGRVGISIARFVLPHADGNAPVTYFVVSLRRGQLQDQHVLGHPALVAGHHRRDPQRKALLAQQRVAAVARAVRPDLAALREVHDVLVGLVARPRHVLAPVGERVADRVQARHELAVLAEHVERALAHAGHDPHADRHVRGVRELHADVGDRRAQRPHRERHHVHRAALHRAAEQAARAFRASPPGRASCWSGPASDSSLAADERAVLDPRDIPGVGPREIGVRPLRVGQRLERALLDQLPAEGVVLLGRRRRTSGSRSAG